MSLQRSKKKKKDSDSRSHVKIITDEPTLEDALDFNNYSQTLAHIITNSTPRLAIGIFGGWGVGKTSLMYMTKKILDNNDKIITVWFDAWKYEREEYLAVIPFLRTVKLTLDASQKSRGGRWEGFKNGIKRTTSAFLTSSKITYGIKDVASAETDLAKVADSLRGDGSVADDKDTIYYHATEYLERGLADVRKDDKSYRIVVFIDDLDRCSPDRALEVLESIKSFFDIEGIVYVIGMDSETINSLVKKKYGENYATKGLDYLQKIVQLPFQIPTWKGVDISKSMSKLISKGLEGSNLLDQFEENKELIVKALQPNPREVKRFINNVILAKAVFDKPTVAELIVVRALDFRSEWNNFLELISPDDTRKRFLNEYKGGRTITSEELDKLDKERTEPDLLSKDTVQIYRELLKQGLALRSFLDGGAADILLRIEKMEEHWILQKFLQKEKVLPQQKRNPYHT